MPQPFAIALLAPEPVLALWLFILGGAVGSFLNVVIYRLPAGMSLVRPGSHCPRCGHPIRWYHNVPVLGWIVLRGRCRDCQAPISIRYPIVEALTAVMFLLVGWVEWLGGGANLPLRPEVLGDGSITSGLTLLQAGGLCAFHLLVLTTLLAMAWIEHDGQRVPLRLVLPALAVGLAAPPVWPWLHPVHATPIFTGWTAGLADGLGGLAAGAILGAVAWWMLPRRSQIGTILGPVLVGLYLGWQPVGLLVLAAAVVHLLSVVVRRPIPPTAALVPLALAWILAWSRLM